MADTPLAQTIQDAEIDARSLSEFISKDASFMVTRRLAPTVHTLDYYIAAFNDVEANLNAAIDTVAQNADAAIADIVQNKTDELDGVVARANATADSVASSAANTAASTAKTRIDKILNDAINDSGFVIVDSFEDGATLTTATQALRVRATGKTYRWGGALPKTVSASSTPETTGGFGLDAWVEVNDAALKQELGGLGGNWLVNNQMAANAYGVPDVLVNVEEVLPNVQPVGYFNKTLWGCGVTDRAIYRSNDFGESWVKHSSATGRDVMEMLPTDDGEVLCLHGSGVIKSNGWSTNPLTATWVNKVQRPDGNVADFLKWGFDGHGSKFGVTHYSSTRGDSRYVWISTDSGETWDIVYDSNTNPNGGGIGSHIHALCYDKWSDRWYMSEGHEAVAGVYFSDDDGQNWTQIPDLINGARREPSFTTMTATDFGIVCGSDGFPNGIWLIRRTENPSDIAFEYLAEWSSGTGLEGVLGFADHSWRDPDTGIVYVSFGNSGSGQYLSVPNVVFAVGSSGARVAYSTLEARMYSVFAAEGKIWSKIGAGGNKWIKANTSPYGGQLAETVAALDRGNLGISRGQYTRESSLRAGLGSVALGRHSVSIGNGSTAGASANSQHTIAIGSSAVASGNNTIAIGYGSNVTGDFSTSLGATSKAGTSSVAIGSAADASGVASIAVGRAAVASAFDSVSIKGMATNTNALSFGRSSEASGDGSIAIGGTAKSTSTRAVALGQFSKASSASAVALGPYANASSIDSVSIGVTSVAGNTGTAVGKSAKAEGLNSSAYGASSIASGGYSTAVGIGAKGIGGSSVAVGIGSQADGDEGVSVGKNCVTGTKALAIGSEATAEEFGIAVGRLASTAGQHTIAIGTLAKSTHASSVAIGQNTQTTRANSFAIGSRSLDLQGNGSRIYLKSPDGTEYYISVSDEGELTATAV